MFSRSGRLSRPLSFLGLEISYAAGRISSIALALLAICIFGSLNTRIGWPGSDWRQEGWTVFACTTMWVSLGIAAMVIMVRSARTGKPCRLGLVLALLVGASLVLQWFPRATTGLQFLPLSPWSFQGWIPFLISVLSWLAVGLVLLALICCDRAVGFPVVMLLFLAVNAPLSFWNLESSGSTPQPTPVVDPLAEYRNQIAEWSATRDETRRVLVGLRRDRETLVDQLQRLGVRSSADLENIPAARPLAEELAEVVRQIEEQGQEVERLDAAVVEAESRIRRLTRQKAMEETRLGTAVEEEVVRMNIEPGEALNGGRGSRPDRPEADSVLDRTMAAPKACEP